MGWAGNPLTTDRFDVNARTPFTPPWAPGFPGETKERVRETKGGRWGAEVGTHDPTQPRRTGLYYRRTSLLLSYRGNPVPMVVAEVGTDCMYNSQPARTPPRPPPKSLTINRAGDYHRNNAQPKHAPVAQWQRRRFVIARSVGSNPPWGSTQAHFERTPGPTRFVFQTAIGQCPVLLFKIGQGWVSG